MRDTCFQTFQKSIAEIPLPERFTFPFYYEPHPLCVMAAEELQQYLMDNEWEHNFGLVDGKKDLPIGKMFGVLVVENQEGEIGYLTAFSGKLNGTVQTSIFAPSVFDMFEENNFFMKGMKELDLINKKVIELEKRPELAEAKAVFEKEKALANEQLSAEKAGVKAAKKIRNEQRKSAAIRLNASDLEILKERLKEESLTKSRTLKRLVKYWDERLEEGKKKLALHTDELNFLKQKRKDTSAGLQKRLFEEYNFLNIKGKTKSLFDIFINTFDNKPPSGAGECAAPKLLQYAFKNNFRPIAIAEFWWGKSPSSEIRKHKQFYPACRGKCEPILAHMLDGIEMDENPMLLNPAEGKTISTVYEDEYLLVINKPAEFLSVPGKTVEDSVWLRMKQRFPKATGPLIVHRLDMSTSGLMLIAKSKEVHKFLQNQFEKRTIKKRYIALLDGLLDEDEGHVNLPIRVDLDNRPQQLVDYKHGKSARTNWKVVKRFDGKTLIHFFPITGRTHQLRVHAAHSDGLNTPIIGDDLYGNRDSRLHLHAEVLEFEHPESREWMRIELAAEFSQSDSEDTDLTD